MARQEDMHDITLDHRSAPHWEQAPPLSVEQVRALMAISRAVAAGGSLEELLDTVAELSARVVDGVKATSIMLISGLDRPFRLAGGYGLSRSYREFLNRPAGQLSAGRGPSGYAVEHGKTIVITDIETDTRMALWRARGRQEGYRSLASTPLIVHDKVVGTLNAYRKTAGTWRQEDLDLLAFFAEHCASSVRTAVLLEQQRGEVMALRRLVQTLREQSHEHANRLHALRGLLWLGELAEAQTFLDAIDARGQEVREFVEEHIRQHVLAGLLIAEATIAAQRDIALEFDPACRLDGLPGDLTDAQAVTILGNLLDNAFDAVADMVEERRRVRVLVTERDGLVIIAVRDWGRGLDAGVRDPFERGVSSKGSHAGVGLALVLDATRAAGGRVEVAEHDPGMSVTVQIPRD